VQGSLRSARALVKPEAPVVAITLHRNLLLLWATDWLGGTSPRENVARLHRGSNSHPVCRAGDQGEAITGVSIFSPVISNLILFPKIGGVVDLSPCRLFANDGQL
jgi:hypothetical protein